MKNLIYIILINLIIFQIGTYKINAQGRLDLQDLELPHINSEDIIIHHFAYTLKYDTLSRQADWVAYVLTKDKLDGPNIRRNNFREDPKVKRKRATLIDYRGSGYDRGHLAPAADMSWSPVAMSESFYLSNISPQEPGFNRGIWAGLEAMVRNYASKYDTIYVVTGPIFGDESKSIGPNKVRIPQKFYKVILVYKKEFSLGIGFILENKSSKDKLSSYAVSIDSVESVTGLDFYSQLPDSVESKVEKVVDLKYWTK